MGPGTTCSRVPLEVSARRLVFMGIMRLAAWVYPSVAGRTPVGLAAVGGGGG
jgi:hypothetical protein